MTSDKQPNASRTTESMSNRTVVTTAFKLWLRGEVARTLDNPIHNPQVAGSTPAASRSPARASVTKQCNLIPAQAGKATSGLASHSLWISAWGGFLSAELRNRINGFFRRLYRYCYTPALVDMEQLLHNADETLFCKALKDVHCLHHLLPELKTLPIQLRPANHNYQLPICKIRIVQTFFYCPQSF